MRLHIRKRQEGQALVEFTIVATLLILLLLGIAQFGIVWNNYVSVTPGCARGRAPRGGQGLRGPGRDGHARRGRRAARARRT